MSDSEGRFETSGGTLETVEYCSKFVGKIIKTIRLVKAGICDVAGEFTAAIVDEKH